MRQALLDALLYLAVLALLVLLAAGGFYFVFARARAR